MQQLPKLLLSIDDRSALETFHLPQATAYVTACYLFGDHARQVDYCVCYISAYGQL